MLNANLTNLVIASLKAAGIKTPELTPIRPVPQPRASMEDLTEILISSEYEDPYEDPKAVAVASQLYIKSLGRLDQGHRQRELERQAATLFVAAALTMAVVCGAVIVSGWFAGALVDSWERLFWLGALLAGVMVATFAAAAVPGGRDARRACVRIAWLLRAGLLLIVLAPALCIIALVGDFYRL